jgi:hypothetical protein
LGPGAFPYRARFRPIVEHAEGHDPPGVQQGSPASCDCPITPRLRSARSLFERSLWIFLPAPFAATFVELSGRARGLSEVRSTHVELCFGAAVSSSR